VVVFLERDEEGDLLKEAIKKKVANIALGMNILHDAL
jgi:hypothetical protein